MTLREIFGKAPMGLGFVLCSMAETSVPELGDKLDLPLKGVWVEFENGEQVSATVADLLGRKNATPSDEGAAPELDSARTLGHPLLGSQQGLL